MKTLIGVIIAGIVFFILLIILSQNAMPDSGLYNFKRLTEKVVLKTKSTPEDKADYLISLFDKRLEEFQYVNREMRYELNLSTSLRYSTTAGDATHVITQNKLSSKAKILDAKFKKHDQALSGLLNGFRGIHQEDNFIKDARNYLKTYSQELASIK